MLCVFGERHFGNTLLEVEAMFFIHDKRNNGVIDVYGERLSSTSVPIELGNAEHTSGQRLSHLPSLANCATYPLVDAMVYNSKATKLTVMI